MSVFVGATKFAEFMAVAGGDDSDDEDYQYYINPSEALKRATQKSVKFSVRYRAKHGGGLRTPPPLSDDDEPPDLPPPPIPEALYTNDEVLQAAFASGNVETIRLAVEKLNAQLTEDGDEGKEQEPQTSMEPNGALKTVHIAEGTDVAGDQTGEQKDVEMGEECEEEDDDVLDKKLRWKKKAIKIINMMLPHTVLVTCTLTYLITGAKLFQYFESEYEAGLKLAKIERIKQEHELVVNQTWQLRGHGLSPDEWTSAVQDLLINLSHLHDADFRRDLLTYPNVTTKWTFTTAVLNALTLVSACGYSQSSPITPNGQMASIAYTMLGIPLMFVTVFRNNLTTGLSAANIGKYLMEFIELVTQHIKWTARSAIMMWRSIKKRYRRLKFGTSYETSKGNAVADLPELTDNLWVPGLMYVGGIGTYCALGTFILRHWYPEWSFVHAFHFGLNFCVTIELGDIIVTDMVLLGLLIAFCVVGLAVVTMCIDMASTHLEQYFMKIHYAGRWKRRAELDQDLRDMVHFLKWMRATTGQDVTWRDVKALMESIRRGAYNPRRAHKWHWIDSRNKVQPSMDVIEEEEGWTVEDQRADQQEQDLADRIAQYKLERDQFSSIMDPDTEPDLDQDLLDDDPVTEMDTLLPIHSDDDDDIPPEITTEPPPETPV